MNLQKNKEKLYLFIFLGFLSSLALIHLIKPQRAFSESENRYLQKRPHFSVASMLDGSYSKAYESYMSDQFPQRNRWVGLKVLSERIQGKRDVNQVYFGKDDYLLEKYNREDLETEQLDKNLEAIGVFTNRYQEQLGAEHIRVMAVPGAAQIMTDKLPAMAAPYDQSIIIGRLKGIVGGELIVPAEAQLKQHNQLDLYYKTDHHWTAVGAYYGYYAWAQSIGLTPLEIEEFTIKTVNQSFLGTVYSKVNIPHKPDRMQIFEPHNQKQYQIFYDGGNEPHELFYNYQALAGKDKYSFYLDGNHGLAEIICSNPEPAAQGKKLLILRDSYAHTFAPFAAGHFETTYLIDLRYYNLSLEQFIEENQITDILLLYQVPSLSKEMIAEKINR